MRQTLLFILLSLITLGAAAQGNLERAVAKIEKQKSTEYVAYSEKRNPKTHKVVSASKVLVVSATQAKEVISAIDKDRQKATSYQMTKGRVYEVTFADDDYACYTLILQRNGKWLLTIEVRKASASPSRRTVQGEVPAGWTRLPVMPAMPFGAQPGLEPLPQLAETCVDLRITLD